MPGSDRAALVATGWAADANALAQFLDEPNLARIATIDDAGRPHVVPAWFWWDGMDFYIGADLADRKVRHVRRTGEAGIEIDSDVRRKRGIYANGAARVIDGPDARAEYIRITVEQVRRYQPGRPRQETAIRNASHGTPVVIVIRPEHLLSWGR